MTPFQQAVLQVEAGDLKAPSVTYGSKAIDYFSYQLATHKFNLSLMAKGMQCRGIKLKDLKWYYGLKGRTAADCLSQFLKLIEDFQNKNQLN